MTLTLYYLDNSRAFRVLWTAYELGIGANVNVKTYARVEGKKAVPELKTDSGFALGKSPFLVDTTNSTDCDDSEEGTDGIQVFESVACMEYLVERYGSEGEEEEGKGLIPPLKQWKERSRVSSLLSFCETPFTHALPIVYAQWFIPPSNEDVLSSLTASLEVNVQNDLDFYESTLQENIQRYGSEDGLYLANGRFSIADIANCFSAEYILKKQIGTNAGGKRWPNVEKWLKKIEARPAYRETKKAAGLHDFTLLETV